MSSEEYSIKIILIGDTTVGKTSLRKRYMGMKLEHNYIPTIGADFALKILTQNNVTFRYSIWDIAGSQTFSKLHPTYYDKAFVAMVVYDVTNRDSFDSIDQWVEKAVSFSNFDDIHIAILANKIDLLGTETPCATDQEVEEKLYALREKYNLQRPINLFRTSALRGDGVDEAFERVSEWFLAWYRSTITDTGNVEKKKEKDAIAPAAFLLTFNDIIGPIIASSNPFARKYSKTTLRAVQGLLSYLEFAQSDTIFCSSIPWPDPRGSLEYIIYPSSDNSTRGIQTSFIIGVVLDNEVRDKLSSQKKIIEGILHSALNKIANYLIESGVNFTSTTFVYQETALEERERLSEFLKELRLQVAGLFVR